MDILRVWDSKPRNIVVRRDVRFEEAKRSFEDEKKKSIKINMQEQDQR